MYYVQCGKVFITISQVHQCQELRKINYLSSTSDEEEIDRRRDTLLREYNLIGDEEYEAGERVREQLRAARLAALDPKPGPSGVTTSPEVNVTPSDANVESAFSNVTTSDTDVTSSDTPANNPFSSLAAGQLEPADRDGLRKRNIESEPRED